MTCSCSKQQPSSRALKTCWTRYNPQSVPQPLPPPPITFPPVARFRSPPPPLPQRLIRQREHIYTQVLPLQFCSRDSLNFFNSILIILSATVCVLQYIVHVVDDFTNLHITTLVRMVFQHQTTMSLLDVHCLAVDKHSKNPVEVCFAV